MLFFEWEDGKMEDALSESHLGHILRHSISQEFTENWKHCQASYMK